MRKCVIETSNGTKLTVCTKVITPDLAKQTLQKTATNRSIQKSRVRRYAHGMKLGEWVVAQPVMIDDMDRLLDGQHRMHAVIMANVPVEFLWVAGYHRDEVFCRVDDVAKRTLKDWLHIMRIENPRIAAGVVAWAARDEAGLIPCATGGHFVLTPIEGVEFYESHPEIEYAVRAPGTQNVHLAPVMSCFAYWKFAQRDETEAKGFFVDLTMGDKEAEDDPLFLLRERMKSDRLAKTKLSNIEKLALVYKTWNAIRTGKRTRTLAWRSNGPTAEKFPEVL